MSGLLLFRTGPASDARRRDPRSRCCPSPPRVAVGAMSSEAAGRGRGSPLDAVDVEHRVDAHHEHPVLAREMLHRRDRRIATARVGATTRRPLARTCGTGPGACSSPSRSGRRSGRTGLATDAQGRPVAHAPHGPFRTRRYELSVLLDERALGAEVEERCCRSCSMGFALRRRPPPTRRRAPGDRLPGGRSPARGWRTAFSASSANQLASPSQMRLGVDPDGGAGDEHFGEDDSVGPRVAALAVNYSDAVDGRLAVHELVTWPAPRPRVLSSSASPSLPRLGSGCHRDGRPADLDFGRHSGSTESSFAGRVDKDVQPSAGRIAGAVQHAIRPVSPAVRPRGSPTQPQGARAVVGDRGCDPRNDWLCALLRPVRSWATGPARLEELA